VELKRKYLKHIKLKLKNSTYLGYEQDITLVLDYLDVKEVSDINPLCIDDYIEYRRKSVSDRTINLEVMVLKSMLDKAVEWGLTASNPLEGVKPLKHRQKRFRRALTADEIERLLEASTERYRPVWLCLVTTGFRKAELVNLTWDDIDWDAKVIKVQNKEGFETKTGNIRQVPVADRFYDILKELRSRSESKYVFVTKNGTPLRYNMLTRFRGTLKRAGIDQEGVDIHSLRYTFITHLIRNGANPKVVQRLAGHRSIIVTMNIYADVLPEDERDAIMAVPYGHRVGTKKVIKLKRTGS
jgi:integrase